MTFNEELRDLLRQELDLLKELLERAVLKTDLIIGNEVDKIEVMTKEEESFVNKLVDAENRRAKLLDSWGVSKDTPISKLLEKMVGDKSDLESVRDEMFDVMEQLSDRNSLNSMLLHDHLEWIDFNVNLMTNASSNLNYGSQDSDSNTGSSLFDRKV